MSWRFTAEVGRNLRSLRAPLLWGCVLACGCAARGVPAGDAGAAAREYIIDHREELEREIQAGSGKSLYELSIIANCKNLSEFNRSLHKSHAEIFPVPPPSNEQVADRIVEMMRKDRAMVCRDLETDAKRPFAAGTRHVTSPENR